METRGVDRDWIESTANTGLFFFENPNNIPWCDFFVFNAKWFGQLTGKIDNLKIGILKEGFGLKNSEADVDKMVRDAAEQLGTAGGAIVEEVSVPMHSDGNWALFECKKPIQRK